MKILMVGAGSVGGFFGAKLVRAGVDCSFLLRSRTLEAIRRNGLTIRSNEETFTVHPRVSSDAHELQGADLIILAVKRYDLDGALEQLVPILTPRTTLLTLQNGVDTELRIQERLPEIPLIAGVAYIYSKIAEPGIIEHYKKGAMALGRWPGVPSPLSLEAVKGVFEQAGIACHVVQDVRCTKWEKMCWNVAFNPLTVLINDNVSRALSYPELQTVIKRVVDETVAVASAEGVSLPSDMAEKTIQWSQEIRDIHTSMYDDWKAGRPTEIEYLNGYIVARAKARGIPVPVNETIVALIKTITEPLPLGPARLLLDGRVLQPIVLDMEALSKLPLEAQIDDVGKVVPGMRGHGIRVKALLELPTPMIGTDHVTFHSADGKFAASLPLKRAAETGILIYRRDERPLPLEAGGPFRLITPGLGDLCANVKNVCRVEFTSGPGKDTRPSVPPQHKSPSYSPCPSSS
jgi:2-dehydropantoate 2-reductase